MRIARPRLHNGTEIKIERVYPSARREISVPPERPLGHLRSPIVNAPPQPNKHAVYVNWYQLVTTKMSEATSASSGISKRLSSHLFYIPQAIPQTRGFVKRNRNFFPRWAMAARSPRRSLNRIENRRGGASLIHSCASGIKRRGVWLP